MGDLTSPRVTIYSKRSWEAGRSTNVRKRISYRSASCGHCHLICSAGRGETISRVLLAHRSRCAARAHAILYVGDRLDNDILPARSAGMRTALIRRDPWGHIHARRPAADLADLPTSSVMEAEPSVLSFAAKSINSTSAWLRPASW